MSFCLFQIAPQKLSDKAFWVSVQEEKLASDDIFENLAAKFSSKPQGMLFEYFNFLII